MNPIVRLGNVLPAVHLAGCSKALRPKGLPSRADHLFLVAKSQGLEEKAQTASPLALQFPQHFEAVEQRPGQVKRPLPLGSL